MTTVKKLNLDDIIEILAKHFEVDISKVDAHFYEKTVGYGLGEYQTPDIEIEIQID